MQIPTRPHLAGDAGLSLIEMLVVLMIIGILSLIALPLFAGQRMRAQDTEAQVTLRTVATALEAYRSDEDTYGATRAELVAVEPTVGEATDDLDIDGAETSFEITERSASGTTFTLSLASDGDVTRTCSAPGRGLCRSDLHW